MQTVPELASSKLAQVHLYSAATRPRKTSSSLMMKQRLVISQKYLDKSHFFSLIVKKKKKRVSKEQACKGIYKPKTYRQRHASLPCCLVKKYHVTHYWLHLPSAGHFMCLWLHIHAKPTLSICDCKLIIVLLKLS